MSCAQAQGSSSIFDLVSGFTLRTDNEALYTLRPRASDWLLEVAVNIDEVMLLPENWNSYGAAAIDGHSGSNAKILCERLSERSVRTAPRVSASADGNLVLCWYFDNLSLEIEVMPDGTFDYMSLDELNDENDRDGSLDVSSMADFVSVWLPATV